MNSGPSETIEVEGLIATSVLDSDNIPNNNQSETCFSCQSKMLGLYCKDCGQKNDDFRRSIFSLGIETFTSIFSLESRMWRSWWTLLSQPGRVAREFADGKRTQWSSPIRIYLAMSLLLFGYIAITQTQLISLDINVQKRADSVTAEENISLEDLKMTFNFSLFETKYEIDERNTERNFDYIRMVFEDSDHNYDLTENGVFFERKKEEASAALNTSPSLLDEESKPQTSENHITDTSPIMDESNDGNYLTLNRKRVDISSNGLQKAVIGFMKDPSDFNETFSKYLPRIMFLMMPFTMFIGALFIRGRGNAFLYDHLVHAAYVHAVLFFLILLGVILGRLSFIPNSFIVLTTIIYILIYLPLSLRRMFRRGPVKTVWTAYGVASLYLFVMMTIVLSLTIFGIQGYFDTV
ncbi:uncharacterized protein DUF3667 [Litorimonas taeanensis]|uniref:Uncharacterized protein DUF3667 n=1 Tax=Litorimonas taeanensis TaxID=568099 RepID=A0A420WJZ6_9PROT|nr:DUF3667 domain-containing protein [Litorimonas taeanensis]RKQ71328.1 uncharacterized protein DUF3667 [Litorimonas taeanensis]